MDYLNIIEYNLKLNRYEYCRKRIYLSAQHTVESPDTGLLNSL
jgi:hypothetical protein